MKIVRVRAIPMSDPVPPERQHRTDLGTKVKSDATLILVETDNGLTGIGAALGCPPVVAAIVEHELALDVVGEDPMFSERIFEKMYNGSRAKPALERGVPQAEVSRRNGMVMEAIAGIDIAVWDLHGKLHGQPVVKLLGGQRMATIPAYVSGLPGANMAAKLALAKDFAARGFSAFKYAAAVSFDGIVEEMRALREALGPQAKLMVDLHWKFNAQEAIQLIDRLMPYNPYFVEAPCAPEDREGQALVGARARVPIALGEEWHTVYEYRPRFESRAMAIAQPEVGHTGISQFMQIGRMANAFHVRVIPHASIGIGIYQAASLHAAAALPNAPMHEYQHSVFDRNLKYVNTSMRCEGGAFTLPEGPGLGCEPSDAVWAFVRKKGAAS